MINVVFIDGIIYHYLGNFVQVKKSVTPSRNQTTILWVSIL